MSQPNKSQRVVRTPSFASIQGSLECAGFPDNTDWGKVILYTAPDVPLISKEHDESVKRDLIQCFQKVITDASHHHYEQDDAKRAAKLQHVARRMLQRCGYDQFKDDAVPLPLSHESWIGYLCNDARSMADIIWARMESELKVLLHRQRIYMHDIRIRFEAFIENAPKK